MNILRKFGLGAYLNNRVWCPPFRVSCHQNTLKRGHQTAARGRFGFTLVELLVVIAIVALLGTVLLPALAGTKPNSQAFWCQNNTRRLTLAWVMYSTDNSDRLLSSLQWIPTYPSLDWTNSAGNTNIAVLLNPAQSLIAGYIKSAALFKCPSDIYQSPQNPGPRIRSYAMSGSMGGSLEVGTNYMGRTYFAARKISDLNMPGPANIYVILDEHADSINDGVFMLNAGYYAAGSEKWRDLPASYHDGAVSTSFADGHSELHKWQDSQTIWPVTMDPAKSGLNRPWIKTNLTTRVDYKWMEDRMPYR